MSNELEGRAQNARFTSLNQMIRRAEFCRPYEFGIREGLSHEGQPATGPSVVAGNCKCRSQAIENAKCGHATSCPDSKWHSPYKYGGLARDHWGPWKISGPT